MSQSRVLDRLVFGREERTMRTKTERDQDWVGPDLPSLSGVVFGSLLFVTGGMLLFTIIGIPLGIPMFAAGLGWMLTPKDRTKR
jgi:hypothetical protein